VVLSCFEEEVLGVIHLSDILLVLPLHHHLLGIILIVVVLRYLRYFKPLLFLELSDSVVKFLQVHHPSHLELMRHTQILGSRRVQ
jgi:hypothetical protein